MSKPPSIFNTFKSIPKELFRVNNGLKINLRVKKLRSFDIYTEYGKVKPRALEPATYKAPNGASMLPNVSQQRQLVEWFSGEQVIVYAVPEGTALPEDLILVHDDEDHYSLQPAVEMTVEELNKKISDFLEAHSTVYTREQWLDIYRSSVIEDEGVDMSAQGHEAASSNDKDVSKGARGWVWRLIWGR